MITMAQEYFNKLWLIQSNNAPHLALLLPSSEKIYEIDLNSRKIESPEFLSIQKDHYAETVYFMVNRYYDHMDLSETIPVIQYITSGGLKRIYVVPFIDIETYKDFISLEEGEENGKIIFPWCIDGAATRDAGEIQYSVRFYKLDEATKELIFNLSTLPTKSKILYGMDVLEKNDDYEFEKYEVLKIYKRIEEAKKYNSNIYWEENY